MRRPLALTLTLLAIGAAPCGAAIVTVDPLAHPSGTDISTTYAGLNMRVLQNTPGTNTFTPIASPALAETCYYAVCSSYGPYGSIGGFTGNGWDAEQCYDATHAGGTLSLCGWSWKVLELNFPSGTDFVQVNALWVIDNPAIIAYDAAGDEVVYCKPNGFGVVPPLPGSYPGCIVSQQLGSSGYMGTFRVQTTTPVITRVVFASQLGSAVATGIQYSWTNPRLPCKCKKPLLTKDEKPLE